MLALTRARLPILLPTLLPALLAAALPAQDDAPPPPPGWTSARVADRVKAVLALGKGEHPRAFELLSEALDDERSLIRQRGCEALGELGDPRALPLLRAQLATDHRDVWRGAAKALGMLGDTGSYDAIAARVIEQRLDWRGYGDPIDALLRLDRDRAVDFVFAQLVAPDQTAHRSLAGSLAKLGDDAEIRERATALLENEREMPRCAGLWALGGVGDLRSVSEVLGHMARPDRRRTERMACLEALGALGHELAVSDIASLLADDDTRIRQAAVRALEQIHHPSAERALSKRLLREEHDLLLVIAALGAVGELGRPEALPAVARWLDEEHFAAQPLEISSVWSFPHNTRVCDAAGWAAQTLLDGKPPCPRRELSGFPDSPQRFSADARAALRQRIAARQR